MKRNRINALSTIAGAIILSGATVLAQSGTCPPLVAEALARTQSICAIAARNEICYGNNAVQTEPATLLQQPGDIAPAAGITSLQLAGLNEPLAQWGVALARLQVNLPDTLPGENVTFLLYGDVVLEPLAAGTNAPVSAFRLKTGLTGTTCGSTPMNGLVVQTPDSASGQRIAFTLNGVEVRMGSTVAFSASPENGLNVATIEGSALVTVEGVSSIAVAGSQVFVPLDEDYAPADYPGYPEQYDAELVENLPISPLEREIEIADPLDDAALEDLWALIEDADAGLVDLEDWFDEDIDTFLDQHGLDDGDDADQGDMDGGDEEAGDGAEDDTGGAEEGDTGGTDDGGGTDGTDDGGGDDGSGGGDDGGGGGDDGGGEGG